jgi:catechol 2,3-dioxygenase-like lactoylglutathione lyase family enzyme
MLAGVSPVNHMTQKIDHINIVVSDLKASANFFSTLGFEEVNRAELSGPWIDEVVGLKDVNATFVALQIPDSETVLELIQYHNPSGETDKNIGQPNQIGFRHMALSVDNISTLYRKLVKKGVTASPIHTWEDRKNCRTKKLCYFKGPDGILLELAQYS